MKPLRICLVSKEYPPEGKGGVSSYVHLLAEGLTSQGHDVTVIAEQVGDSGGSPTAQEKSLSPRLYRIQRRRFPLPSMLRQRGRGLWEHLEHSWTVDRMIARLEGEQGSFDIIEMPNGGFEAFFYCLHSRAPYVVRVSTPLRISHQFKNVPYRRIGMSIHLFLEAFPVRRADRVITHSRYNVVSCARVYSIPSSDIRVVPLGVRIPRPMSLSKRVDGNAIRILYVGRLQRRKGIHLLLEAIPIVVEKIPNALFFIAGLDSAEARLMSTSNSDSSDSMTYEVFFEKNAAPTARMATAFLGHVDQATLDRLYAECDIVVAPSLSESFGLMYAEGMANAKPVVAFRTASAPEVVVHNETGILVQPNDVTELANALITLAKSWTLRQEMGKRGYQRAQTEFSVQRMVSATEEHYRQVIAMSGKGSKPDLGRG